MRLCSIDGCSRPHVAKGYCNPHYIRWKASGDPGPAEVQEKMARPDECTFDDCSKEVQARGLCKGHYMQQYEGREMATLRPKAPQGSGWVNDGGYHCITVNGRTWLKHRLEADRVLREHHGRELQAHEEVHHVNGDKSQNWSDGPFVITETGRMRSGNLECWSKSQPPGQEIGPKWDWALDIVTLYADELDPARRERLLSVAREMLGLYGTELERAAYGETS